MPDGVTARVLRLTPSRLGPSHARRSCPPVRRPGGSVFAAQYPAYAHPCQRSSDSPLEEEGFEPSVPLTRYMDPAQGRVRCQKSNEAVPNRGSISAVPTVRIPLPPPASLLCTPSQSLPRTR
jgi:hypothetical protein